MERKHTRYGYPNPEVTVLTKGARSQSAMEYLMTYGWAILIIAVVLGALYSLGVFNAVNFMPKVPGGGCHVFRPNGPGTSWNINLVGSCNNALPQYVAQFNGQSSPRSEVTASNLDLGTNSPFSISVWINPIDSADYRGIVSEANGGAAAPFFIDIWTGSSTVSFYLSNGDSTVQAITASATFNAWQYFTFVYTGSTASIYKSGALVAGPTAITTTVSSNLGQGFIIGQRNDGAAPFYGSIANVQVYNTSLTANQVQYLYNEGIGGVPISPQYLVGWWPLNGDTTDYSGNNNNGAATAITFNGTWTGGYNAP